MHDVVESLQVSSSALDVILHAAYFMSEVLLIEALPSYGLSSEECLSPSTSLQPRSGLRRARRLNGLLHRCCLAGRRAASTAPRTRKPRTRRQSARTQCPTLQAARRRGPPAAGSSCARRPCRTRTRPRPPTRARRPPRRRGACSCSSSARGCAGCFRAVLRCSDRPSVVTCSFWQQMRRLGLSMARGGTSPAQVGMPRLRACRRRPVLPDPVEPAGRPRGGSTCDPLGA